MSEDYPPIKLETQREAPGATVIYWLPLLTFLVIAAAFILLRG